MTEKLTCSRLSELKFNHKAISVSVETYKTDIETVNQQHLGVAYTIPNISTPLPPYSSKPIFLPLEKTEDVVQAFEMLYEAFLDCMDIYSQIDIIGVTEQIKELMQTGNAEKYKAFIDNEASEYVRTIFPYIDYYKYTEKLLEQFQKLYDAEKSSPELQELYRYRDYVVNELLEHEQTLNYLVSLHNVLWALAYKPKNVTVIGFARTNFAMKNCNLTSDDIMSRASVCIKETYRNDRTDLERAISTFSCKHYSGESLEVRMQRITKSISCVSSSATRALARPFFVK